MKYVVNEDMYEFTSYGECTEVLNSLFRDMEIQGIDKSVLDGYMSTVFAGRVPEYEEVNEYIVANINSIREGVGL